MNAMSTYARIVSALTCLAAVLFVRTADAITVASDNASNPDYADGWQNGDNGGTGFGPWTLSFSGNGSGLVHSPQFVDNGPLAANSLGAPAFALTTGDQPNATETSAARRTLLTPIGVGQVFSAEVNGSALLGNPPDFTVGNTFDLLGTNGSERFSLFTNNGYHSDHWTATGDADTGIPAGSSFRLFFTLVTPNTYDLALLPLAGGSPLFTQTGASLAGTSNVGISQIRITAYGTGSSADGSREMFFDNLLIKGPDGDYNANGSVDAADYVAWRDAFGQAVTAFSGADGSGNGQVDTSDYDVWRTHFGQTTSGNTVTDGAVPEPAASAMLLGLLAIVYRRCARHRCSSHRH
jgi:hypothetical protein